MLQVLHTFPKGLLQSMGMICTSGLCLPDCNCTVGLHLLDGHGSLSLILMQGSFGIRYQPSLVGVHGGPSYEQLTMAAFISLCSQSTSSDRALWSALGQVLDYGAEGMLATVRVFDPGGGDSEWLIGIVVRMSSGMAVCCDACEEVAIGSGVAESALSRLSGSSTLVGGGAP